MQLAGGSDAARRLVQENNMAKSPASVSALIKVQLNCVYSGHPANPGPGDIIEVDATEADRLVELGAAKKVGGK